MPTQYKACLVGCGRMGATIDDEVRHRPDSSIWLPFSHAAACVACDQTELVAEKYRHPNVSCRNCSILDFVNE